MEKNVCDSVIGTLLNIQVKMKDGLNTRQDLADMGIQSQLHPRSDGKKIYLPSKPSILDESLFPCQILIRGQPFFWNSSHAWSGVFPEDELPSSEEICIYSTQLNLFNKIQSKLWTFSIWTQKSKKIWSA